VASERHPGDDRVNARVSARDTGRRGVPSDEADGIRAGRSGGPLRADARASPRRWGRGRCSAPGSGPGHHHPSVAVRLPPDVRPGASL